MCDLPRLGVPVTKTCTCCNGIGGSWPGEEYLLCPACSGTGVVEAGPSLVEIQALVNERSRSLTERLLGESLRRHLRGSGDAKP